MGIVELYEVLSVVETLVTSHSVDLAVNLEIIHPSIVKYDRSITIKKVGFIFTCNFLV